MMYDKQLKILFLEDLEADKELAVRELINSGLNFSSIRVETKEELQAQVIKFAPDIIISDYSLPKYNGMQALKFIKENYPSIPFILFTGSINEETAVECMKTGADDYIIKEHLTRLPFAVSEVLTKFSLLKEKKDAERALIESEERFRSYVVNTPSLISIISKEGIIKYLNRSEHGIETEFFIGKSMYEFILPEKHEEIRNVVAKCLNEGTPQYFETYAILNGELFWYENKIAPLIVPERSSDLIIICSDQTEKKKNEERIKRLNRANMVLSKINRAIVWNHDPVKLLDEACKIVIKDGGFLMAWIGMINPQSQKIEVSASSDIFGNEHNSDLFNLTIKPNPGELAFRRKKKVIINDVENDDLTSSWRDISLKFGIKSVISLPLWRFGKTVGVFNMYSSQAGFFDDDEIRLLKELTSDVSFALEFIKIDIERFNAEKALIESEKDYRNLFEQANDAIIIFRPANEIIIEVNNKACELYGFKKEEMIGMSFKKLTKDTLKGEKKIKELLLLKKIQNYETIQNRKDGTPIYVSVNASLINYKNEEVIQSINRDITQNTKNLEALRVSENKYRTIFQTANEGICVVDVNDKIVSVNDKLVKMLGFSEDELCKLYYEDIISSTDVTRQRKMYFDQKDGKVNSYERRLQCKDGTNIWALVTVSPILSKAGVYQGAFGMFADITEQKKMIYELVSAKEKAEEMNKVKSSFFANMSHELRTPFVGIIGFAEIIKETAADTEIAQMASGIIESSKRMTTTLNNILDLTKLEYGNLELYFEHVNVEGLIDEVYHSFFNDAAIKGLAFEKRVSGFTTPVNSDRSLLRSILTGFISNAIKYTRQGKIEILADRRMSGEQEFLVIQISDTGIGIAKETQAIIWNEFRQASEGLNRNFEGTGLGLTLCKKYVELLNGKIYLQSEVGVGSTFTAEIPVTSFDYETDDGITTLDAHANIPFENGGKLLDKKILYIDDDPLALEVVGRYLSNEFSVECVSSVPQFLEKLKEFTFDCVLMDISLGGEISGINLINEVKQIEKYYNTPVVAITAYALKSDEELILSKGFSHYISKPFEKNYMLNLLKRVFTEK